MDDVIQVQNQYYILATASRVAERTAVLQHDDTFALFDRHGDIGAFGVAEQGLYHEGTRYVSRFRLRLNGQRPLLLSARVKDENELYTADLTNPDIPLAESAVLARDILHLFRGRFLWDGTWHERIRLWNYSHMSIHVSLTLDIEADFADIFEVRGTRRTHRGTLLTPETSPNRLRLGYRGLDSEERWTTFELSEPAAAVSPGTIRFEHDVPPHEPIALSLAIHCDREKRPAPRLSLQRATDESCTAIQAARSEYALIESSSERFNQWVRRSAADLRMLTARTPQGEYPYAGVPWFSTPFGRDGIITAMQCLWINPRLAHGVLNFLAATQADAFNSEADAEPGKILHETRFSEMARLGEVPFGRYYGSIDATPLFVILAGRYFRRTGDREAIHRLWPHIERALDWIQKSGDRDGDMFVEYERRSATGLVQQGWKDSQDAIFHADGTLAEGPIALCEVQGYVYLAKLEAAFVAEQLGHMRRADRLRHAAEELRAAFEERFWCDDLSTYALALDGRKQPCRVRTSNAGHTLFAGIASPERARRVADGLVGDDMFSGWGIRTVSSLEHRYNPMSYHNGSVWPHDNGMAADGFAHYGLTRHVAVVLQALFDASVAVEDHRLPELFCGFHRRPGEGPTLYPVACSPQAWAAGAVFQLVESCLRISLDADRHRLSIEGAVLPPFLDHLDLSRLRLPFGEIDLRFEQHSSDVSVSVLRKVGDFELHIVK